MGLLFIINRNHDTIKDEVQTEENYEIFHFRLLILAQDLGLVGLNFRDDFLAFELSIYVHNNPPTTDRF
jgi:hypothetical protein